MISMQGVPSALILKNESWVRQQAQALSRRLPSNVERADLIQVGLIAVAQSAVSFVWEGEAGTTEAEAAFVRYARQRVRGAMLDELRQMDHLGRTERRNVKVVQVARERWRAEHGNEASAAELSEVCELSVEEIFRLDLSAASSQTTSLSPPSGFDEMQRGHEPATPEDEVEARVETSMLMRRLEVFFATLPERDRRVIDAYLGVGMTPVKLAQSMDLSLSRVSQLFGSICRRIGIHFGHADHRSTDRAHIDSPEQLDSMIVERESELSRLDAHKAWSELFEKVLSKPHDRTGGDPDQPPLRVSSTARWG